MKLRRQALLYHPDYTGVKIAVNRWFWQWWFRPKGFATYEEVFEYYAKCKRIK